MFSHRCRNHFSAIARRPLTSRSFLQRIGSFFPKLRLHFDSSSCSGLSGPDRQSKLTSIFFLTSIFNHSIHSSIAVFYSEPHIHEKWKGRIETWQPRKRQKRRAKRNNSSSHQT